MIQLIYAPDADRKIFDEILQHWGVFHNPGAPLVLVITKDRLVLRKVEASQFGDVFVEFTSGSLAHRRRFGGGAGEAIAKAVGVKRQYVPHVMDATAGLGRDAFILASLGCKVTLFERNPVVGALLEDGLRRAYADPDIGGWMQERMRLISHSSFDAVSLLSEAPDVVYLDPMFPHRQKSALVKKEMQLFQLLVDQDDDADKLLPISCKLARKRVVVKRPSYAPFLNQQTPQMDIKTKNHRFDIYLISHIP